MKRFLLPLTAILILAAIAATVAPNIPISQMPIAPVLQTNAWIPIIQPLPGRTTNDNFRVAPSAFAAFLGTNNTSGSNVYNTIITTNLTVVTNLYLTTNTYIVNVTTNLEGLWTDTLGDYTPTQSDQNQLHATNIFSVSTLHSSGALIFDAAATYNFLTPTNVCINPYNLGYLLIDGATTNASDTQIRLEPGNGSGAVLFIQNIDEGYGFHMLNGDTLCSDPLSHLYLKGGDWYSTHEGETIMLLGTPRGWAEIGRFGGPTNFVTGDLWQDFSTFLAPVAATNVTHIGTDGYIHIHGPSFSELQLDGPSSGSFIDIYNDDTQSYINISSPLLGGLQTMVQSPTLAEGIGSGGSGPFWFGSIETYTNAPIFALLNGTNALANWKPFLSFGPASQINFSPTNVLYRSTTDLVYTNGDPQPLFKVINGSGATATLGLNAGGSAVINGSSGSVYLGSGGIANSGGLQPNGARSIGAVANSSGVWTSVVSSNLYIYGHLQTTNDSLLKISHTGTNGAIVLDSQSAGDAGVPRRIEMQIGGYGMVWVDTNVVFLNLGSIYGPQEFDPHIFTQNAYVSNAVPTGLYGTKLLTSFNATSAVPGYSPLLSWIGSGWSTNNAGPEQVRFSAYVETQSGNLHPDGVWRLQASSNELSPHSVFGVTSAGVVLLNGITKAEKSSITPVNGMLVYQTDNTPGLRAYVNGAWVILQTAADP